MWGAGSVQVRLQLQAESCDQAMEGMNGETQPYVIVEIGFDKALKKKKRNRNRNDRGFEMIARLVTRNAV